MISDRSYFCSSRGLQVDGADPFELKPAELRKACAQRGANPSSSRCAIFVAFARIDFQVCRTSAIGCDCGDGRSEPDGGARRAPGPSNPRSAGLHSARCPFISDFQNATRNSCYTKWSNTGQGHSISSTHIFRKSQFINTAKSRENGCARTAASAARAPRRRPASPATWPTSA